MTALNVNISTGIALTIRPAHKTFLETVEVSDAIIVPFLRTLLNRLLQAQVMLPLLFVELLNGISQARARHRGGMLVQELQQLVAMNVAGRAQHPAGAFVNQVFFVIEQHLSNLESVGCLTVTD